MRLLVNALSDFIVQLVAKPLMIIFAQLDIDAQPDQKIRFLVTETMSIKIWWDKKIAFLLAQLDTGALTLLGINASHIKVRDHSIVTVRLLRLPNIAQVELTTILTVQLLHQIARFALQDIIVQIKTEKQKWPYVLQETIVLREPIQVEVFHVLLVISARQAPTFLSLAVLAIIAVLRGWFLPQVNAFQATIALLRIMKLHHRKRMRSFVQI